MCTTYIPQPSIMRYWYWLAVCVSTWKAGWWFVVFCSQITKIKFLYIHTRLNKWILGLFNFCRARPMEWGRACAEWWLIANDFQKYVCNSLVWPCWYSPTIIPVAYSLAGLGSNFLLGLENSSPHTPHLPWLTSLCCTCHYKEVEKLSLRHKGNLDFQDLCQWNMALLCLPHSLKLESKPLSHNECKN